MLANKDRTWTKRTRPDFSTLYYFSTTMPEHNWKSSVVVQTYRYEANQGLCLSYLSAYKKGRSGGQVEKGTLTGLLLGDFASQQDRSLLSPCIPGFKTVTPTL